MNRLKSKSAEADPLSREGASGLILSPEILGGIIKVMPF
jgi:hypothetical protein